MPKVPEFWCSFFSNTKLLIFGNFYFIIRKSLNSFKDNSTKNPSDELTIKIMKKVKELSDNSDEEKGHIRVIIEKRKDNEIPNKIKHSYN